jgi:hypothetical protein
MTISVQKVVPGDLITAAFVNELIDLMLALDARVTALEAALPGSQSMRIFAPISSDTFHIGDELRIIGQGFGVPALNTVLFDGTARVNVFKTGSNDNLLILDIPGLSLPAGGKAVTLSVSNNRGFAQTSFNLLAAVPTVPNGQLFLAQQPAGQQIVQAPGFDLKYLLTASTTLGDAATFSALFGGASAGFDAFLADDNNNRLSPDLQLGAQSTTNVHIRVVVPAQAQAGTQATVTLGFASKANPNTVKPVTTGALQLTVGQPAPGAEKVKMTLSSVTDNQGLPLKVDAQGIFPLPIAKAPASFFILVSAAPGQPGNYTVLPSLDQGATGWPQSPVVADPPGGKLPGLSGQKQIQINVTPAAQASQTNLTVRVQLDSDPNGTFGHVTLPIRPA